MSNEDSSQIGVHISADLLEDLLVAVKFTKQTVDDIDPSTDWEEVEERLEERINKLPSLPEDIE